MEIGCGFMKLKGIIIFLFWRFVYRLLLLSGKYKKTGKNLLVVDTQAIGDAIMVSPIFKNLRTNSLKECRVDVVCWGVQKPIYERIKEIDNIYVIKSFEEYFLKKNFSLGRDFYKIPYGFYICKYVLDNLINKYDVVIEPRWEEDTIYTAILVMLTGAENRYGFSEKVNRNKARRNFWRDKYFTKCFMHDAACYEGKKFLDLIENIGYTVHTEEVSLPYNHNGAYNNAWGSYVVFALDASDNRKEWDCDNFSELAKYFLDNGLSVVLLGKKKERGDYVCSQITHSNLYNCVGKTTLSEAIDIIGNGNFYVGCDTGLSHIAGAVGISGIVIFPSSKLENPESVSSAMRMRPSGNIVVVQPELPLPPCKTDCISKGKAHCINGVKSEDVIKAIECNFGSEINGEFELD